MKKTMTKKLDQQEDALLQTEIWNTGQSLIAIEGVSKTFLSERGQAIEALSPSWLQVEEKDFVCIVGPSGCGKSTLLRIVAGLEHADTGQVLYKNRVQRRPQVEIGMVFQQYSLLPWRTVEENIMLGMEFQGVSPEKKMQRAEHFLEVIDMKAFRHVYPYELSGGMQQRVAIARALANNPQVLLMDEPFGALDAHTRIIMQRELLQIWEQDMKTVLFVTHSVDEAIYLADRIVVMSAQPGTIKEDIAVDLPRPRTRAHPLYGEMSEHILNMLEQESELQTNRVLLHRK